MNKFLFLFFWLGFNLNHNAFARSADIRLLDYSNNFERCTQNFPNQKPILRKQAVDEYELCNGSQYAVLYEGKHKIPKAVFAFITTEQIEEAKTLSRKDVEFIPDPRLSPEHRALPNDYVNSGYDRGHMLGNAFFGRAGQELSFLMSNISPQLPSLNRELFSKIEQDTRKYIKRTGHSIYLAVGQTHQVDKCTYEIKNGVCVIDQLWIAVYDPTANKSWAFLLQNAGGALMRKPISIKTLETQIGYRFWEIETSPK